jgi:excisionase family DNA binding protein
LLASRPSATDHLGLATAANVTTGPPANMLAGDPAGLGGPGGAAMLEEILRDVRLIKSVVCPGGLVRKEAYTTEEAAAILNRSDITVREWCRHGRVRATKRATGRGRHHQWQISHAELVRIQNEGLLPLPEPASSAKVGA